MFKVGQKVVCIKTSLSGRLKVGKIYTITDIKTSCKCGQEYNVDNLCDMSIYGSTIIAGEKTKCPVCGCGEKSNGLAYFSRKRFAPIDESFAEETLEMIKEQIEEEYLVLK
jgi:hypothetical protein